MIPFNKPYFTGKETAYIEESVRSGKVSGDGIFSEKCHLKLQELIQAERVFLTTSCTDALEMSAILLDISEGDEVIMPSYTFVSTANAFVLRGAKIVFADCEKNTPNMDVASVEALITNKTKAIVPVHYAGMAVDMDPLLALKEKYKIAIVEDAAQAICSTYKGKPLGSFGDLSTFSFHETKNIISGEGGALCLNDVKYLLRTEIIREKGTNRSAFFRGAVDKYNWVDIGSSFLPSDMIAAFLYAQLENLEKIQNRRIAIWNRYNESLNVLEEKGICEVQHIPEYASVNGHMYYLVLNDVNQRDEFLAYCRKLNFHPVFHYQSLHKSPFFKNKHDGRELVNSDKYSDRLVRLPLYFELSDSEQQFIIDAVLAFFK